MSDKIGIKVSKNGPFEVYGNIPLSEGIIETDKEGYPLEIKKTKDFPLKEKYCLCRCGCSKNKPFCDASHSDINFNGKETASNEKYIRQAEIIEGDDLILMDAFSFCSGAGFCNAREGNTWDLTLDSKNKESKNLAVKQACQCPSGRLVALDKEKKVFSVSSNPNHKSKEFDDKKTKKPIEPNFEPSIMVLHEPWKKVISSLWVRGKIPIESSEGKKYEIRNRVTLCRCGKSANKPFCDGAHRTG